MIKHIGRSSSTKLVCALAGVVSVFALAPPAAIALEHPFLGDFGEVAEPSFTEAEGLAVDQSTGDLLVIDAGDRKPGEGTVSRYHSDGTPSEFPSLGSNVISGLSFKFPEESQVAVDNSGGSTDGRLYVAQNVSGGAKLVEVFAADGSFIEQLTESSEGLLEEPCGVGVDPAGNVYVGDFSGKIHKFANPPTNGDTTELPFSENCTLAAGAGATSGYIFPSHLSGPTPKLDSTSGTEVYPVDSGPTMTVTVDPVTGHVFVASGNEIREYDASGASEAIPLTPITSGGEQVTGVAVDGATGRIYVSRKGNPHIEVWGAAALLPIAITEEASVSDGIVTLHGAVNANEGPEATCEFQFVEVAIFKKEGFKAAMSVPCSPGGPFTGTSSVAVSAAISVEDLPKEEGAYRYRLVAENEDGSKAGDSLVFQTFATVGLPDGRAYEMVSPPQKVGEVIPPEPAAKLGGSCGDCLPGENELTMPMQTSPEGNSVLYLGQPFSAGLFSGANEYVAPRGESGWGLEPLSAPMMTGQFVGFSEELDRGVLVQAPGDPALSPHAPIRGGKGFSNLYLVERGSSTPLITVEPPNRDVGNFNALYSGANAGSALVPAFEHVVFEANDALSEEAPEVEAGKCTFGEVECNLYEWVGEGLRLVNVLPNGEPAGAAVIGAGRLLLTASDAGLEVAAVDHAISDDGSRIFWSSEESGEVYVRIEGKETLQIPGAGTCKKSITPKERACFLSATPDGSAVLLSDGTLYELNETEDAYEEIADLTDEEGGFEGILGAAEDLSRIYFIDTEALTEAGKENENGEHAEEGEFNLYLWEEGELTFIGILAEEDNGFGTSSRYGAWKATSSNRTAQVSADGGQLAFMSLAPLTGYDNALRGGGDCRSSNGPPCREVFVYAADFGALSCASCNPSGEQPLGDSNLSLLRPDGPPFRQPGNLTRDGSGRLVFESQDALVAADSNGSVQDVYEWEPEGVGSCDREAGCVYLISSGQSPNDSMFLDSSQDGADAFFITREQLLPQDKNQQLDLYDAREGGGFPEPAPPSCNPETCAGPLPSPPVRPSFGSIRFSGPGNPKPPKPKHCKAGFVKKNGKCVKKHKKKKAKQKQGGSR